MPRTPAIQMMTEVFRNQHMKPTPSKMASQESRRRSPHRTGSRGSAGVTPPKAVSSAAG